MYTIHSAAVFLFIYFFPLLSLVLVCVCVCIQTRIQASNLFGFTIHSIRPAIWHKCVLLNSRRVAKGGGFESFIPRRLRESLSNKNRKKKKKKKTQNFLVRQSRRMARLFSIIFFFHFFFSRALSIRKSLGKL